MSLISHSAISAVLLYFARIILISGLLFGYYQLCLRNAPFHGYNRFYLLGITALSLLLPILPLPAGGLFGESSQGAKTGILHAITTGNWGEPIELSGHPMLIPGLPGGQELLFGAYLLISLGFLAALGLSILYIVRLSARSPQQRAGDIRVFMTAETGTPFSFLNLMFWNNRLDMNSSTGRQIFRHELYHVRQKHTVDLLALEMIRALCWWNPFFHLIPKEIKATHEFLADRYASGQSDRHEYAELLVWQSVGNSSPVVHSFFNTHLKRRITMLTRSTNTKPGYFNRIMALPLLLLLFCAFATRSQKKDQGLRSLPAKTITVVIDAGHGGSDNGTHSADLNEKDLNLAIAKKVQQLASSYNINVLMTREEDKTPGNGTTKSEELDYRVNFANEHKADLFISIHVNSGDVNGIQVWLSSENPFFQKSASLGSAMVDEMKKVYATNEELMQRKERIRVLAKTQMPAILIECGNMSDQKDLAFISKEANQEAIARSLLQGVLRYEEGLAATPATGSANDISAPVPAPPPPPAPVPAVQ